MNVKVYGTALALMAMKALRLPSFIAVPGRCQQFARQVFEADYGVSQFPEIVNCFAGTAKDTMLNFQQTPYNVWDNVGSSGEMPPAGFIQAGDYLYKGDATSGPDGHVGIAFHNVGPSGVPVIAVAENSSYHMDASHDGNVSGAKGFRSLAEFAPTGIEMVVRLSEVE